MSIRSRSAEALVVAVAVVAVAGCAAPSERGVGVTASSPVPRNGLSLSPSGKPTGPAAERAITGVVEAGVESNCLVLTAEDGVRYLLLDGDPAVVRVGAELTLVGRPTPGVVTTCMQGLPFAITQANPAG